MRVSLLPGFRSRSVPKRVRSLYRSVSRSRFYGAPGAVSSNSTSPANCLASTGLPEPFRENGRVHEKATKAASRFHGAPRSRSGNGRPRDLTGRTAPWSRFYGTPGVVPASVSLGAARRFVLVSLLRGSRSRSERGWRRGAGNPCRVSLLRGSRSRSGLRPMAHAGLSPTVSPLPGFRSRSGKTIDTHPFGR